MPQFQIGDHVRLLSIPAAVIGDRARFPDTFDLLERAVGKCFHIQSFNDLGMAELWMKGDASEDTSGSHHSVWIEQEYLSKTD